MRWKISSGADDLEIIKDEEILNGFQAGLG
jgi:hypothetical protein